MAQYIKGMLFGNPEGDEALETLEIGVALALTAVLIGILVMIFSNVQTGMENAQTSIEGALADARLDGATGGGGGGV